MLTAVFFHAHPDDEAIASGGTIAQAKAAGHRVVLLFATRGELGEPIPGVLADGEELWQRRVAETHRAAEVLGADRVEFLGYHDSGMMGEPTNADPRSFWQADVATAARQVGALLAEEQADLLCVYDEHGGYGHPDHIQVHRVGVHAATLAETARTYQMTMNRDAVIRQIEAGTRLGDFDEEHTVRDLSNFGSPEALITHAIDVAAQLEQKRAAMLAHESQISLDSFFFTMGDEAFATTFGTEWYIELGVQRNGGPFLADLFA